MASLWYSFSGNVSVITYSSLKGQFIFLLPGFWDNKGHNKGSDIWSLIKIAHQMPCPKTLLSVSKAAAKTKDQ
jgi:hypothetical protein